MKSDIRDVTVKMMDHQLFRADRQQGIKKGGVAVFVRDDFATESWPSREQIVIRPP